MDKEMGKASSSFTEALSWARKKGYFKAQAETIHRIPTGVLGIDFLLGGGIPRGRICEIYGVEHSGKTTLAAEWAKAFQRHGLCVLYLDFEHAVDLRYFKSIGVDLESNRLWLFEQPFCLEDGINLAIKFVSTGVVKLVVVDSVASMCPRAELEGRMDAQQIGLQPRLMGKALRILVGILQQHNAAILFINQVRDKIGSYVPGVSTPGGRALKFYSSVRLQLDRSNTKSPGTYASMHRAVLRKQKTCAMQAGATEFVISKHGIDRIQSLITSVLNVGIVKVRGSTYFYGDRRLAQGRNSLYRLLRKAVKLRKLLEKRFFELMQQDIVL